MRVGAGGRGWIATALCIVVIEAILLRTGNPTLSEAFGKALEHPLHRLPVMLVWGFLTLHLFSALMPEGLRNRFKKYDPLARMARLLEKRIDEVLDD